MLVYIRFPVFSPFSAHFYPPLHHNGKGSIYLLAWLNDYILTCVNWKSCLNRVLKAA